MEGGTDSDDDSVAAQLEAQFPGVKIGSWNPLLDEIESTRLELVANYGGQSVPVQTAIFTRRDLARALVPSVPDWGALRPGALPDSLTVRATHAECGVGEGTIELATKYIEIPIVRPSGSRIDVVVRNASSVSASNHRLAVYAMRDHDPGIASESLNSPEGRWVAADGTAFFESLGPGDYSLELWLAAENAEVAEFQLGMRRIRFIEKALVEFELPALHELSVEVKGASACAVRLSSFDDPTLESRTTQTDAGGSALFSFVPPGRRLVGASDGANVAPSLVRIPEQSSLSLELASVNCYRVWITEPAGALAKAGFQEGELILAVDDLRYDGGTTSVLLKALSASKGRSGSPVNQSQNFAILRGGGEISIEWTLAENQSPSSAVTGFENDRLEARWIRPRTQWSSPRSPSFGRESSLVR